MTKTLADMTAEERDECVGMWCSIAGAGRLCVLLSTETAVANLGFSCDNEFTILSLRYKNVTPRFDLPRAWTPDGEPVEMVKEYGIFYTLRDGDEEICFVHDSPLSVEPAVKHLEKSLRRGTITKITRKTQWVTEWEEVPEPQRTNGMVNPYV